MPQISINEEDYLNFLLFNADHSPEIRKKWNRSLWINSAVFLIGAIFFLIRGDKIMAFYFVALVILYALFHQRYIKWRYKRHYRNHVKNNLSERLGQSIDFDLTETHLYTKDRSSESNVDLKEVNEVIETVSMFFIKLGTGVGFIIPKREITDVSYWKNMFKQRGLKVSDHTDWKW